MEKEVQIGSMRNPASGLASEKKGKEQTGDRTTSANCQRISSSNNER
jgi:hypothetical protein